MPGDCRVVVLGVDVGRVFVDEGELAPKGLWITDNLLSPLT